MSKQRLQKIIAQAGVCSRRKAEILLAQNRVVVNGEKAHLGDKADPCSDNVYVDNLPVVKKVEHKVFLLNKPIGVISSCKDPHGRLTVLSLLPANLRKGLHPVGRLDLNSRGAILLTNHGELTLRLTHPRYSHAKTYHVKVEGIPSKETLKEWRNGVILNGQPTLKASIHLLQSTKEQSLLKIILKEGRKRQIRRVAKLLGHPIVDLQRIAIGPIQLNNLQEGHWRELTQSEYLMLTKSSDVKE